MIGDWIPSDYDNFLDKKIFKKHQSDDSNKHSLKDIIVMDKNNLKSMIFIFNPTE